MRLFTIVMLCAGCPTSSAGPGAPRIDQTLTLTVEPDRALARGETVALRLTAQSSAAVENQALLLIDVDPEIEITGSTLVRGSLQPGAPLALDVSVRVPDDVRARKLIVLARMTAKDGQLAEATRVLEAHPDGGLHAASPRGDSATPLLLDLSTSGRLRSGSEVNVGLLATAHIAHPRFELGLQLPNGVTLTSGAVELAPRAVAAGEQVALIARVRVEAATPLEVRGFARYGRPGEPDFRGGNLVSIEDRP